MTSTLVGALNLCSDVALSNLKKYPAQTMSPVDCIRPSRFVKISILSQVAILIKSMPYLSRVYCKRIYFRAAKFSRTEP